MKEAVILSAARTAVGKYGGSLKNFSAPQLGAFAITEAVKLSSRFIPGRQLPDKAVIVLDTAAPKSRLAKTPPPPKLKMHAGA